MSKQRRIPASGRAILQRGPAANEDTAAVALAEDEWTDNFVLNLGGREGETSVLNAPTLLMRSLIERARKMNLPRQPASGFEQRLHPVGIHMISRCYRVFTRDDEGKIQEWVRAFVRLRLDDDEVGNRAWCEWLDFDTKIIGQLIDQAVRQDPERREGPRIPPGYRGIPGVPQMPRWVGTHSFESIFKRACELAQMSYIEAGQTEVPTRQVMSTTEATLLAEAHVLCIEPEQVAVLPEWENVQEVFDYALDAVLPFDPLFLDFSGPGGLGPALNERDGSAMTITGALVWRQPGEFGEVLMVAPYGWPTVKGGIVPDVIQLGGMGEGYALTQNESIGWFALGAPSVDLRDGEIVHTGETMLKMGGSGNIAAGATTCWADACARVDPAAPLNLPGYAIMPFGYKAYRAEFFAADEAGQTEWADHLLSWGGLIWTLVAKTLAALSITEAVEVEFVDAPVERRVRKRAEKRRWPIAQQVVIHSHSKRYRDHPAPSGEEAHYSHRFWRRATTAHYPLGTMMADARPDLVTPCKRPPESNCGFCRKVKRPACIVGPKDKPLVLKSLVRKAS